MKQPEIISNPNISDLRKICAEYIEFIKLPPAAQADYGAEHHDFTSGIFETAMETLFGAAVFEWIDQRFTEIQDGPQ